MIVLVHIFEQINCTRRQSKVDRDDVIMMS